MRGCPFVSLVAIGTHPRRSIFGKNPNDIGARVGRKKTAYRNEKKKCKWHYWNFHMNGIFGTILTYPQGGWV
jgi:hypothetical protein